MRGGLCLWAACVSILLCTPALAATASTEQAPAEPVPVPPPAPSPEFRPQPGLTVQACVGRASEWADAWCDAGPVPFARVTATDEGGRVLEAVADEQGLVRFEQIDSGRYTVHATNAGFEDGTATVDVASWPEVSVFLAPMEVPFHGRILMEGEPHPIGFRMEPHDMRAAAVQTFSSDRTGDFEGRLASGHYTFTGDGGWLAPDIYVDGTPVTIHLGAPRVVEARVTDPTGTPVEGARIQWWKHAWPGAQRGEYHAERCCGDDGGAVSDRLGRFHMPLQGAQLDIMHPAYRSVSTFWMPGQSVVFVLEPVPVADHPLRIRIVDEAGAPRDAMVDIQYPALEAQVCTARAAEGKAPMEGLRPYVAERTMGVASPYPYPGGLDDFGREVRCSMAQTGGGTVEGMAHRGYAIVRVFPDWCDGCRDVSTSVMTLDIQEGDLTVVVYGMAEPTEHVRGRVVWPEGVYPEGSVSFWSTWGHGVDVRVQRDGRFDLRVHPGPGTLTVHGHGTLPWEQTILPGPDEILVELVADPSWDMSYRAEWDDDIADASGQVLSTTGRDAEGGSATDEDESSVAEGLSRGGGLSVAAWIAVAATAVGIVGAIALGLRRPRA